MKLPIALRLAAVAAGLSLFVAPARGWTLAATAPPGSVSVLADDPGHVGVYGQQKVPVRDNREVQPEGRYEALATRSDPGALLHAEAAAWSPAARVSWGPEPYATSFGALWSDAGLYFRFDVSDPDPWYTLTRRDEKLWNEEVVELFLDVGSTRRSYAEIEINPTNAVVDLWIDRPENRYDKDWDAAGLVTRVKAQHDPTGLANGWTATAFLPWSALAGRAPAGVPLPPRAGDRWRFNAYRIERPGGAKAPEKDALFLPWAPTGGKSFHVPEAFRELVFLGDRAGVIAPPAAGTALPPRPRNVVSIVTDDQASWSVGAYGNPDARTPVLDRLAKEGARFTNAFVTSPVCSPSRAGFLSGRYGIELGVRDWITPEEGAAGLGLPGGTPTWPALLQASGFRTALVGKWHLGRGPASHPTRFGIERFFGFVDGGNAPMDARLEVDGREQVVPGPLPDRLTDEAIRFVSENRDRPFALLLHFREPHLPYGPVPEVDAAALRDVDPAIPDLPGLDRAQVKKWTRDYLASVHAVDRNVGRLLETLDRLGLGSSTLVLFTGDNGYNIGQHTIHTKGNGYWIAGGVQGPTRPNMWDTSLRVPLLVRGPGVAPGRVVDAPVTQLDTLPSLLSLLGVPLPAGLVQRGLDFAPLLRGEAVPWRDAVFGDYDLHHYALDHMRMVRTAGHKLVRHLGSDGADELYDLQADPGETRNLYTDPAARAVRDGLEARLLDWRRSIGDEPAAAAECREQSRVTMGCSAVVRACGDDAAALDAAIADSLDEIDRFDRLLSHYRRDSPLSRLNREAAAGPVVVDRELFELLDESLRWSRASDGAFDVTVGPLMKAWGFFRDEGHVPDAAALQRARALVGYRHVRLDPATHAVRFDRPGVELDLGGIGKGYAVDRAVARLRARGIASALVNLGGSSVYGLGAAPGGGAWEVGIRDPMLRGRVARTVRLRDRALSVSGGYERFFEKDGVRYSHIMDPRTGSPVASVLSVAVLSDSATTGDAVDDVLFVQGPGPASAFLARVPGTEALLFLPGPDGGFRVEARP